MLTAKEFLALKDKLAKAETLLANLTGKSEQMDENIKTVISELAEKGVKDIDPEEYLTKIDQALESKSGALKDLVSEVEGLLDTI